LGSSRSVIITLVLALLVVGGALGGAFYLRSSQQTTEPAPPPAPPPVTATSCRTEPCSVLVATTLGNTKVELVADAGGKSGRLRINGDRLIESSVTDRGVRLTESSLECVSASISACLIKGDLPSGGTIGEVVVSRSDKWNLLERSYLSDAGHLSLADVNGEGGPELIAVQKGYFAQVFLLDGSELGCTRTVAKLEQLPGWPKVKPVKGQLKKCD
jgi:hypothetical protein